MAGGFSAAAYGLYRQVFLAPIILVYVNGVVRIFYILNMSKK